MSLRYTHVDVFADSPFSGNALPVFLDPGSLSAAQMLRITQELRQFETIFLWSTEDTATWRARVFDLHGELPFAGHPVLGAAAVLHRLISPEASARTWSIDLSGRIVRVDTSTAGAGYTAVIDQGEPEFLGTLSDRSCAAEAFGLTVDDLSERLPLDVVTTGLRYLIVPVRPGALERASVRGDLTELVTGAGAEFAVLFDDKRSEVRHWDNDGRLEDVATGSAAGTIGAYCLRHGLRSGDREFALHQGRFLGRPSVLRVLPKGTRDHIESVCVGGNVAFTGTGTIEMPT